MKKQLPNVLTMSRILAIPLLVMTFYLGNSALMHQIAAGLFLFASITDFLDGYLARAWQHQSTFGRFLDPIADKLLVGATIVMLLHYDRIHLLPALAIICREILVSGLREFLAELQISMPVSNLAKVKTAMQMVALFLLLLGDVGSYLPYTDFVGNLAIWLAAGLTLFTGYAYLKAGLEKMHMPA